MKIYKYILDKINKSEPMIAALFDPDSSDIKEIKNLVSIFEKSKIDLIFVGGSTTWKNNFHKCVHEVKAHTKLPIVIFPGSSSQISKEADAILFLSLVSGRNPEYLIGEHIKAAPILKNMEIEVIPTGYLLIEGGITTTVEFISGIKPIPQEKFDIARTIAYTAELLGMKLIYIDCGSGAKKSPDIKLIESVKNYINIPLIVGGGIRSIKEIEEKHKAGADIVVLGSILENEPELLLKR
jgi:putative glycerol-1-phosphate prenyltransferase